VSFKDVGSELVPGDLLWLENGIDGICGRCRNTKKAKWNNGNSEEEFLVEWGRRRLAADKAIAGAKSQNNQMSQTQQTRQMSEIRQTRQNPPDQSTCG